MTPEQADTIIALLSELKSIAVHGLGLIIGALVFAVAARASEKKFPW